MKNKTLLILSVGLALLLIAAFSKFEIFNSSADITTKVAVRITWKEYGSIQMLNLYAFLSKIIP